MRPYEKELIQILNQWDAQKIRPKEVFLFAETVHDTKLEGGSPSIKTVQLKNKRWIREHETRKISWELIPISIILENLLDMQISWITEEDLPAIKNFLSASEEFSYEAWLIWDNYWLSIDWNHRRKEISQRGWPYMFEEEDGRVFLSKLEDASQKKHELTRDYLIDVVREWKHGEIAAIDVSEEVNWMFEELNNIPDQKKDMVLNLCVNSLRMIKDGVFHREDADVFIKFLRKNSDLDDIGKKWETYRSKINFDKRKEETKKNTHWLYEKNPSAAGDLTEYILTLHKYLTGKVHGRALLDLDDRLTDLHSPLLSRIKSNAIYDIFKTIINMYNPEEKKQFPLSGLVDDEELKHYAEKMLAELLQMQSQM